MKNLLTTALVCLTSLSLFAQKIIEKTLPYNGKQRVNLDLKFANAIQVKAWDKAEVYVKVNVTINGGRLNDALRVDFDSQADEISVKVDFDEKLLKQSRREDCPDAGSRTDNQDVHINVNGDHRGSYVCSDIIYEVYLPRQANVHLESISGNMEITDLAGPLFAKSISGFVDVSWPQNKGANIAMQSITGEVYSDLPIHFGNRQDKAAPVGYLLKGQVNGGGPEVRLESISNNVYLRAR